MVRLVLALATALVLAGCGGSPEAPEPTPVARDAVGGYRLDTVITSSTLPDNPAGPASKVSTTAFLSCADDDCSALLQRAASTDRPQGNTTRLEPRAGGFSGEHIRVGECGGTNHGTYGEAFTWSWARAADGVLTGTLKQVFQGCGIDGATTFTATATPDPELELPYLPASLRTRLVTAINAYDVNVSAVYLTGAQCDTVEDTTTVAEAACFATTYEGWRTDIEAFAEATRFRGFTSGACAQALGASDLATFADVVGKAADLYGAATGPATIRAALKAEGAATKIATAEHSRLITVAAMCTDPRDVAGLGQAGVLGLDHGSVLPPLDDVS